MGCTGWAQRIFRDRQKKIEPPAALENAESAEKYRRRRLFIRSIAFGPFSPSPCTQGEGRGEGAVDGQSGSAPKKPSP